MATSRLKVALVERGLRQVELARKLYTHPLTLNSHISECLEPPGQIKGETARITFCGAQVSQRE